MHDRRRHDGFDPVEQRPELALDLGERSTRGDDQNIRTGVVGGVCGKTILPRIGAEAEDRNPTVERVIDLAGFVPFQGGDHQPRSVEEAPALELGSQRRPIHQIKARVAAER